MNAVAGQVEGEPVGAELVFGVAVWDGALAGFVPGGVFNFVGDFKCADGGDGVGAGADAIAFEELAVEGDEEGVLALLTETAKMCLLPSRRRRVSPMRIMAP